MNTFINAYRLNNKWKLPRGKKTHPGAPKSARRICSSDQSKHGLGPKHLPQSPRPHRPENRRPCSYSLPAGRGPLSARGPSALSLGHSCRRLNPTPQTSARPGAAAESRPPSCPGVFALRTPPGSKYRVPGNNSSPELICPGKKKHKLLASCPLFWQLKKRNI